MIETVEVTALRLLAEAVGDECSVTGHQIADMTQSRPDLRRALLRVAGTDGQINTRTLGCWLRSRAGRTIDGWRVLDCGVTSNSRRWVVERVHVDEFA